MTLDTQRKNTCVSRKTKTQPTPQTPKKTKKNKNIVPQSMTQNTHTLTAQHDGTTICWTIFLEPQSQVRCNSVIGSVCWFNTVKPADTMTTGAVSTQKDTSRTLNTSVTSIRSCGSLSTPTSMLTVCLVHPCDFSQAVDDASVRCEIACLRQAVFSS